MDVIKCIWLYRSKIHNHLAQHNRIYRYLKPERAGLLKSTHFLHVFGISPGSLQPSCVSGGWFAKPAFRENICCSITPENPSALTTACNQNLTSCWYLQLKSKVLKESMSISGGEGEWKNKIFISGHCKKPQVRYLTTFQMKTWQEMHFPADSNTSV